MRSSRCSGRTGPALEGDYVLAVGTLEPRKNLARVIEAARRAGVELRLVGAPGWGDAGVEGAHVTWLGRIDDDELAAAYRGARAVVFPSLYEGFGIPALEAMASGTPLVTSRDSAMAEVAGAAAVLVDPLDVAADRCGHRGGRPAAGRARAARPRTGEALRLGARCRRRRGRVREGARVTEPLVVVDADVLGRRRTGDETYVLNLLRALAPLVPGAGMRVAAVTRRPELVPTGIEAVPLGTSVQELRMARDAAAPAPQARAPISGTSSTRSHSLCPARQSSRSTTCRSSESRA